jgi:hypothetical protein
MSTPPIKETSAIASSLPEEFDEDEDPALDLPEPDDPIPSTNGAAILQEKENSGFTLPPVLREIKNGFDKVYEFVNQIITPSILKSCGLFFQVFGLSVLLVGTIHTAIVLATTPLSGGLIPVVIILINSGALPIAMGGFSLWAVGNDLYNRKYGALYYILMALPFGILKYTSEIHK